MIGLSPPTPPASAPRPTSPSLLVAGMAAGSTLALIAVLGLSALLGERVRDGALIAAALPLPHAALRYTDAPQSAAFFEERDSVTVRVPWDMTVREFLSLYHLENNTSARAALERIGVWPLDELLREGDEVSFRLTVTRGAGE